MPLKLAIFDLDGTLIDSEADLADSVNELRGRLGLRRLPRRGVAAHVGQGAAHLLRMTVPGAGNGEPAPGGPPRRPRDLRAAFLAIYRRRCLRRTRLYPGVRGALRALGRLELAVASNKPTALSRRILRGLGLGRLFAAVLGGDAVRNRKPHPEAILRLMRRFRTRPAETLVVGDSRYDMEAGRRARCRLCACTWGFGTPAELRRWRPDAVVSRPAALPAAIRRLS